LQWDLKREGYGRVAVYINGVKLYENKESDIMPFELAKKSRFCIGSWVVSEGEKLTAVDFDIAGIRVSNTWKYDKEVDWQVQHSIVLQQFDQIFQQVNKILETDEPFILQTERQLLIERSGKLKLQRKKFDNYYGKNCFEENTQWLRATSEVIDRIQRNIDARYWDKQNALNAFVSLAEEGVHLGVFSESPMLKICPFKSKYSPTEQKEIQLSSARNEYETFQLLLASFNGSNTKVSLYASNLRLINSEETITADNVELFRVRPLGMRFPDILLPIEKYNLIGWTEVGCFWVNVYVPINTTPGLYTGVIKIEIEENDSIEVPYSVMVWNFELPIKPALKTAFGFTPESVEAWTPDMANKDIQSLTDEYLKYMLRHRTSPKALFHSEMSLTKAAMKEAGYISGKVLSSPTAAVPSNIDFFHPRQILKKDGSIVLDFEKFDNLVEKYLPLGLNSFIAGNRYWDACATQSAVPTEKDLPKRKYMLWVYDEELGKERPLYLAVLSDDYKRVMTSVFRQWQDHLEEKGWLDMGYAYIVDEPRVNKSNLISEIYGIAKNAAPDIPLMVTHKPSVSIENVDIFCPTFHQCSPNLLEEMGRQGQEMWYYVCNVPQRPFGNFLLWQQAIEHRILFWQTFKYSGTGFLYWEIAYWKNEDPWAGFKGKAFSHSMDGSLVYPGEDGPVGSIRYEIIREGIEDYDYLILLKKAVAANKFKPKHRAEAEDILSMSELVQSPTDFSRDPFLLLHKRHMIGEMLNEISN